MAAHLVSPPSTILIAENDLVLRLAFADYLRACDHKVIECSGASEAKRALEAGVEIDILFADALLAGDGGGFSLANWARHARPDLKVVLAAGLAKKTRAIAEFCHGPKAPSYSLDELKERIAVQAQRKRSAGF